MSDVTEKHCSKRIACDHYQLSGHCIILVIIRRLAKHAVISFFTVPSLQFVCLFYSLQSESERWWNYETMRGTATSLHDTCKWHDTLLHLLNSLNCFSRWNKPSVPIALVRSQLRVTGAHRSIDDAHVNTQSRRNMLPSAAWRRLFVCVHRCFGDSDICAFSCLWLKWWNMFTRRNRSDFVSFVSLNRLWSSL